MIVTIPKFVKTGAKIGSYFYFQDFVILLVSFVGLFFFTNTFVHSSLKIVFLILNMCIVLYLVLPSFENKRKRNYDTYIYLCLFLMNGRKFSVEEQDA